MRRRFGLALALLMVAGLLPAQVLAASAPKFTVEPGGGAVDAVWAQQPQVAIKTGNHVDGSATGTISLTISPGTGTPGAVLTCSKMPEDLSSGIAVFTGCRINVAGTAYRLIATWNQGGSDVSAPFNIGSTGGTKLGFVVQPARGIPGVAFAVQPSVAIQDSSGTTVVASPLTVVTLALGANPGGATLTCPGGLSNSTVNGVAVFSGCSLDRVGVGFTLTATATALTPGTSALFDVADRLAFTTQPAGAASGIAFTTQPAVAVRAGSSATATHDSATIVALSIKAGTGASGAVLTCAGGLSRVVSGGVAAFSGCSIDKASPTSPANPYVIIASASGLSPAESAALTVTAGGPSVTINQAVGQADPTSTSPINFTVIFSAAVTGFATGDVTVTGTAGGTKVGTVTGSGTTYNVAVTGMTTTGTVIATVPASVAVNASSQPNAASTSTDNTVTWAGAPTSITLANSASVITWGQGVTLAIQFGTGGGNRLFTIERARDGVTWYTEATLTTNASGYATYFYRPATNNYFRIRFAGAPDLSAGLSNTTRTVVRQIALLRPTNGGLIRSIARNTSITFTTTVRPARPELPPATVSFRFFRLSGGAWTLVTTRDVVIDAFGKAVTTFKFTSGGSWYARAIANPTSYNANSVWSPVERYNVR